jgi:peptidoglycan/LPS O-acetylase OafA/YrhL
MRFPRAYSIASSQAALGASGIRRFPVAITTPQTNLSHPKYRPDIDGLRAVAVLSVLGFHAFPSWVRGGFIGVDVFFVISGFLISTIIFENLDRGTFSFSEFYARRIKRIFPALILVLAASYVFGWFALLSDEYRQLGKHIAAGAGFVSNFVLWKEGGYFDAENKPLLHLWSLGIEEQFYIVWPLFLWCAWKWKFGLLTVTFVVASISFILNVERIRTDSLASFYSPQTRFWELLCGSMLAWLTLYKKEAYRAARATIERWVASAIHRETSSADGRTLSNVLSCAGLFLLAFGLWRIDEDFSFPGMWAVVPVLGAVLIIAAGSNAWVNRIILSNKVAVWFGLISFPLYLWHWPLLSFARIVESEVPSRAIRIAAVALSIVLAWLTYKLVENPIRSGKGGKGKVSVLLLLVTVLGCVGYSTYNRDGLSFRENATLEGYIGDIGHLHYHKYMARRYFLCRPDVIAHEAPKWEGFVRCMQSKSGADVEIALVGDSHAEHLFAGIAEALNTRNVAYYIKNSPAFLGNPEFRNIFDSILTSKTISHVVITMMWYRGRTEVPPGSTLYDELLHVVDALSSAGKRVYLTDDIPTFPFTADRCQGKRWLATKDPSCEMSVAEFRRQTDFYVETLTRIAQSRPEVRILSVGKYFCDDQTCRMTRGDEILYRDRDHLNLGGSLYIGKRLIEDNIGIFD